jgi:hypothetical protein
MVKNQLYGVHTCWLVVWNKNFMTFHSVGNVIIPTDELIFIRGVGIPPTSLVKIDMGLYGINVWNKLDIDLVKFGSALIWDTTWMVMKNMDEICGSMPLLEDSNGRSGS